MGQATTCGLWVITCRPRLEIAGKSPVDSLCKPLFNMKTGELFKRRLNFDMAECVGGVLGLCQSIDDVAETALTGEIAGSS